MSARAPSQSSALSRHWIGRLALQTLSRRRQEAGCVLRQRRAIGNPIEIFQRSLSCRSLPISVKASMTRKPRRWRAERITYTYQRSALGSSSIPTLVVSATHLPPQGGPQRPGALRARGGLLNRQREGDVCSGHLRNISTRVFFPAFPPRTDVGRTPPKTLRGSTCYGTSNRSSVPLCQIGPLASASPPIATTTCPNGAFSVSSVRTSHRRNHLVGL